MVQDYEKNVAEVGEGQNESFIKKQVCNAESLWKGFAEKSFEIDPNYKTWGYVKGICVYLGFEAMNMVVGMYFSRFMQEHSQPFQSYVNHVENHAEDSAISRGTLEKLIEVMPPVIAQAVCVAVFYVFLNVYLFNYAKSVLKHHGKVLTGGMNYYSLLAIFMPFYFVYQCIGLPFAYGFIALSLWAMKKLVSEKLTEIISQTV